MKETFTYFIDAIVFAAIFALTVKLLAYFKIDLNYIYIIVFTLIIFVAGKMGIRKFLYNRKKRQIKSDNSCTSGIGYNKLDN